MARIRSIKPEFPEDESLGGVSRDARFLYILLWTRCDDLGRFRASPALLAGQLYPYDDDVTARSVTGWLDELVAIDRVRLYEVNGQQYAEVVKWSKHQRIDNASKQNLMPAPPWADDSDGSPPPAAARGDSPQPSACGEPFAAGGERSGGDQEGSGGGASTAASRAESALVLLADRITDSQPRRNASRYKSSTLAGLKRERGVEALELANRFPDWSAVDIAEALEPSGNVRQIRTADPSCSNCAGTGQDPNDPELPCGCKWRASA